MSWTSQRARVASLSRSRESDDPELVAARSDLQAERFADRTRTLLADAPPLTPEQRDAVLAAFAGFTAGGGAS